MKKLMTMIAMTLSLILLVSEFGWAQDMQTVRPDSVVQINPSVLKQAKRFTFKDSAQVLIEKSTQAAQDKEDDGEPTGPTNEVSRVFLKDKFSFARNLVDDFESKLSYSNVLYRDHTSINTYYFHPAGYLLEYDEQDGFGLKFLHRTRTDDTDDDLLILSLKLVPRHSPGSLRIIEELANYAIKPANGKAVNLLRFPVTSVKVNLQGINTFIPSENITVANNPREVGDPIRIQATMTQSQKEDIVSSIRDGGLEGEIDFVTNNGSFGLPIDFFVSFTDFAGNWLSDLDTLSPSNSLKNISPHPVLLSGLVVYEKSRRSKSLKRRRLLLQNPVVIEPGQSAMASKSYADLVKGFEDVVAIWPEFSRVECESCLDDIEKAILTSAAQATKIPLPIEIIPVLFERHDLFKVLVEVRSKGFSAANDILEVKTFTLRSDSPLLTTNLFVNRSEMQEQTIFEYRVKPFDMAGTDYRFTPWTSDDGVLDITLTAADIRAATPPLHDNGDEQDSDEDGE